MSRFSISIRNIDAMGQFSSKTPYDPFSSRYPLAVLADLLAWPIHPGHEREELLTTTEVATIERWAAARIVAYDSAPPRRIIQILRNGSAATGAGTPAGAEGDTLGAAIQVRIDDLQLREVVGIGVLIARRTIRVACVIHAGPQVGITEILILMIEAKVVGDLLT